MKALFLLLMLAGSAGAQVPTTNQPLTFYQSCFGGIDVYHDSAKIDNCDFQDARNVRTDKRYLEKRAGSYRVSDGLKVGYPIVYQNEFVNVSNTDKLLVQASSQIFSSDFGSAFVEIATVNVAGVTSSVSAFGKHFFVNGYDTPWYTTGVDYVAVPQIPATCKYIIFAQERLWCADNSTVYTSAFGDYTNWTIPTDLTADTANSWTFDAQDGQIITGIYSSPYGVLVWKRLKTFVVKGFDNEDFYKFRLTDSVGCSDNRSAQVVEGFVTWLGEDGVYQWTGGNQSPTLISKELTPLIKSTRQNLSNTNARNLTTPEDFTTGLATKNGPSDSWSGTNSPGSILPASWEVTLASGAAWAQGTLVTVDTTTVPTELRIASTSTISVPMTFHPLTQVTSPACITPPTTGGIPGSFIFGVPCTGEYIGYSTQAFTNTTVFGNRAETEWHFTLRSSFNPALTTPIIKVYFMSSTTDTTTTDGYMLKIEGNVPSTDYKRFTLYAVAGGVLTQLGVGDAYWAVGQGSVDMRIAQSVEGIFKVYPPNQPTTPCITTSAHTTYTASTATLYAVSGTNGTFFFSSRATVGQSTGRPKQGVYMSPIFDTALSTTIGGPFAYTSVLVPGTTITFAVRESSASTHTESEMSAWTTVPYAMKDPRTKQYWQTRVTLDTIYSTETPRISDFTTTAVSTGTWDSPVLFVGTAITEWGQFLGVSNVTTPTNITYYVRTQNTAFTVGSGTPAWVLQPNGLNVVASTGTYAQIRIVSNINSSTETAKIDTITVNWFEGKVPQVASVYYDKNYYLSVALSTGVSSNDTTFVFQRNGKWVIFDGLSYGTLGLYDKLPYAGSGLTDSKIWRIMNEGSYYDDNDKAINAYVITKDFQFDGQNNNKILRQFYLESYPTTSGVLSMAYSVDKSTTYFTTNQSLVANTMWNDEVKGMFPGYAKGRYVKFKFSNNIVNEYFKLDAFTILGEYEKLYRR